MDECSCSIVTERLAYSSYLALAQLVNRGTNHASNVQIHLKFVVDSHTRTYADPGIYLRGGGGANQVLCLVLQSKVEGEARIEGANKCPRIEGEARVEGTIKRLRIEGEARTQEKTGEG